MTVKILILLGVVYGVWKLWTHAVRAQALRHRAPPPAPPQYEAMARCTHCGVHVPVSALSPEGRCGRCA